jgi:multiple sugar transport system ATP-binding protein
VMVSVEISKISKRYGANPVLRDVSLHVRDGEFLALLGPSGCGKSTLLRILAGLETQDAGTITIDGRQVDGVRPKSRNVAMVFQSYALYPHLTVAGNISLPLRMSRLKLWQRLPLARQLSASTTRVWNGIHADVHAVAEALDIEHLLSRKPKQLSGGQRQRVALGRAMVRAPAIFLMDEPLSNLDAKLRVQMRAEIKELHRRLGATFIYVTHDQSEAMTMSDRVAVLVDGQLLQVASPAQIYVSPADRRVAEFVGSPKINILDAKVIGGDMIAAAGASLSIVSDLAPDTELYLGIRPEALKVVQGAGVGVISGHVRFVEHLGSDLFVHLSILAARDPLIVRVPANHSTAIHPGDLLHVSPVDNILVFDAGGGAVQSSMGVAQRIRSAG